MPDGTIPLVDYPGGLHITLMYMGPLEALAVLGMMACLGFAIFRSFSPTGNTLLTATPLALGAWRALMNAFLLIVPTAGIFEENRGGIDIDWVIMGGLADIRAMLILGFLFSSLVFLAILLRNRRRSLKESVAS